MTWQNYLSAAEVAELAQIAADKRAGQAQAKRIYDRCRKRMNKSERAKNGKNDPQPPRTVR